MQDPDLVGMPSSVEVSNGSLRKGLSAEMCTISLPETSEGAEGYPLSRNRQLDGCFELEDLPSKDDNGGDAEAPLDSLPDAFAAEAGSTWGDFESFSEVKMENLSHMENLNGEQAFTNDIGVSDHQRTTSCGQLFSGAAGCTRHVFPDVPMKASLSSEDVIKLSFPEVPVPQCLEGISSLNQVLDTKTEDVGVPEHMEMQPCTGPGNLWKTLAHPRNPSSLRCLWNESHCHENLLAVLGINAHQKVLPEGNNDDLEKISIKDDEDSNADKFSISKTLIQTKLSASPDPRQSHLFTYNLFLKTTPSTGSMQHITAPQKKRIFMTQKLKMFSSSVC